MRGLILCALIFLHLATQAQAEKKRVLFLGNSYTGNNNLPQVFKDFSDAAGDSVITQANTPGGFTLQGHSTNTNTLSLIQQGNWDYVTLQEQSQIPSFPIGQVQTMSFPFAKTLNDSIEANNPCAETVFYMTWGRENGDNGNCAGWPPVCTYEGMDDLLYERYMQMTEDNDAIVSPVGAVWRYLRENHPSLDLYVGDGSHPTKEGTYAAACAFYTVIHRKNPSMVAWDYTISAPDADLIRMAAKEVVFDSLSKWFVGTYDTNVTAGFSFDTTGLDVQFTNTSQTATEFYWFFGDNNTSSASSPLHTYGSSGTYNVTLVAQYCNQTDSLTLPVTVFVAGDTTDTLIGIQKVNGGGEISVFPNPASSHIQLAITSGRFVDEVSIEIYDLHGRLVLQDVQRPDDQMNLNVSQLDRGAYLIRVSDGKLQQSSTLFLE